MIDSDFVLDQLRRGPATTMDLIRESIQTRGCGLTPHSRVADLRRDGYDIRCARTGSIRGRGVYEYTLVGDAGLGPAPAVVAGRGAEIPALPDVNPDQLVLA